MVAFGYTVTDEKGNKLLKKINKIIHGEYVDLNMNIIRDTFMYDKRESGCKLENQTD